MAEDPWKTADAPPSVWRFWRAPVPLRWLYPVYFCLFAATLVTIFIATQVASILWGLCGVALAVYGLLLFANVNGCADYVATASRRQWGVRTPWLASTPAVRATGVGFLVIGAGIAAIGLTGNFH